IPPCLAIAIAISASVTVSIPALMKGVFKFNLSDSFVSNFTSFGKTFDSAGINKTSSNVNPSLPTLSSRIFPASYFIFNHSHSLSIFIYFTPLHHLFQLLGFRKQKQHNSKNSRV